MLSDEYQSTVNVTRSDTDYDTDLQWLHHMGKSSIRKLYSVNSNALELINLQVRHIMYIFPLKYNITFFQQILMNSSELKVT